MNSAYWIKNILSYLESGNITTNELIHVTPLLKNYQVFNVLENARTKSENKIEELGKMHIASFYGKRNLDITFEMLEMLLDSNIIYFDAKKKLWKNNIPKELSDRLDNFTIKKKVVDYIKTCYKKSSR